MSYQPYLIANFATGYDRQVQPWLSADDAFYELLDAYVYRGVVNKRDGYNGFANGIRSIYTESRIVENIPSFNSGFTNDGNLIPNVTLSNIPVSFGSVFVTDGVEIHQDDGEGNFLTANSGSINYDTGIISNFQFNAASNQPILISFDYFPGLPGMGVMNFYPTNGIKELIVADPLHVNKYDPATDRLVALQRTRNYNFGLNNAFWSWVNYEDANSNPRLLFTNGIDPIQQYDGTNVSDYPLVFNISGSPATLSAQQIFSIKGRLILFGTRENSIYYPKRIRISGTGQSCDTFDSTAIGAGFIDIPDNTKFYGADFNRDDLIFYTESSSWIFKYTGNDSVPFILQKIDGTKGSKATFSVKTYLNRTMAASPRGLTICDGYQIDRMDYKIPDFAMNEIKAAYFDRCYSGFIDEDRDVYMLYPSDGDEKPDLVPIDGSDKILVTNFEEDNFAIYRLPLSCMGNFQSSFTILWSDLTPENGFPNWDAFGDKFSNWNAFPYDEGDPICIGLGHKGEVWRLNNTQSEDNPVKVRNISIVSYDKIQVTTDWNNYNIGDIVSFESVKGMIEINDKQGVIEEISQNYKTFIVKFDNKDVVGFSPYLSGGLVSRCIPLEFYTKKFNPWINSDKKIKCGWIYFYIGTSKTNLTDLSGNPVPAILNVSVLTNNNENNSFTNTAFKYEINCSPDLRNNGDKKWVKIWINQVGEFLQFCFKNAQSGAKIKVHAIMLGLQPYGRII